MNARLVATGVLLAGIGVLYACGDTTAPIAPTNASSAAVVSNAATPASHPASAAVSFDGGGNHGHKVRVLRWNEHLKSDLSAHATIGPHGGTISIPRIGAVFTVPEGALSARTTITMRADHGRNVVFEMQPNGLKFAKPATLTLDLSFTNAYHKQEWAKLLSGGYITSPVLIGTDDGVTTYEDEPATVDAAVTTATFPVPHFSVVILASQFQACCTSVGGRN